MKTWFQSCRRLIAATGATALAAALSTSAHALLNDGIFELDGNVADAAPLVLPDDWADFNAPASQWHTKRATGIVGDPVPAVFRNGSKDTQDISSWRFDLGSSPPKDDMLHAYAAAYTATATTTTTTAGDLLIYFGADRDSFSGSASLGFWFFKQPVQRNDANGTFINPITGQLATHTEGDTLIAFEYTNGGAVTSVRIFRWQSGALVDAGAIGVGATNIAGVFCDPADKVCGSTNSGNIDLPWNGTIQAGRFFEGGINLSKEFPGSDTCFASFMATSRSSSQSNASIKNFLLGAFPVCSLSVTKACNGGTFNATNNTVTFNIKGRVVNDGGGPLSNIQVMDSPVFDANSLQFRTCDASGNPTNTAQSPASLAVNGDICFVGSHTSTNQFTVKDTVTASASTGIGTISGQADATCSVTPPPLGISVSKVCDLDLEIDSSNKLALKVNFSGSVTNTGGARLTGVKVCETHEIELNGQDPCDVLGHVEIAIGDMDPGAVVPYNSAYYPTKALNGMGVSVLTTPHLATFKDQVTARGTRPTILGGGTEKSATVEAVCPLCQ